jgi:hypothetical protein
MFRQIKACVAAGVVNGLSARWPFAGEVTKSLILRGGVGGGGPGCGVLYPSSAENPGSPLPSRRARNAPPPVEI